MMRGVRKNMFRINIKLCDIFKINLILMPIIIPLIIVGLVLDGISYNLGVGLILMGIFVVFNVAYALFIAGPIWSIMLGYDIVESLDEATPMQQRLVSLYMLVIMLIPVSLAMVAFV